MSTTITLHLPCYRDRSLKMQTDRREAELAFDAQFSNYLDFLRQEGARVGVNVEADDGDADHPYSIAAADRDAKKAAHDWLDTQPDIWNWMP